MLIASSGGRQTRYAAVVAGQLARTTSASVTRKELSAVCRMAQEALGLRASIRIVLSELVASWGEQNWDRLLVWPSNDHLMRRTGLAERTIRDTFRALIDVGLMLPKDSPNGKRYPIRNREGTVIDAYGFDLTPLYERRDTWARLVAERKAERERIKRCYDAITVARRASEDALSALATHYPATASQHLADRFDTLCRRTPRRSGKRPPDGLAEAWMDLRAAIEEHFFYAGNGGEIRRHNEANNESLGEACNSALPKDEPPTRAEPGADDSEPTDGEIIAASEEGGLPSAKIPFRSARPWDKRRRKTADPWGSLTPQTLPVAIEQACPAALVYGREVRTPDEIVELGRFLRAMLGASQSVWNEAEASIGPLRAAVAVIYVVQLYEDDMRRHGGEATIRNPGGYLRAFVRMVAAGQIDLAADLLAMRRRRLAS